MVPVSNRNKIYKIVLWDTSHNETCCCRSVVVFFTTNRFFWLTEWISKHERYCNQDFSTVECTCTPLLRLHLSFNLSDLFVFHGNWYGGNLPMQRHTVCSDCVGGRHTPSLPPHALLKEPLGSSHLWCCCSFDRCVILMPSATKPI